MFGAIFTYSFRSALFVLNLLPEACAIWIIERLMKLALVVRPELYQTALTNLEIAFPEKELAWRHSVIRQAVRSHARLVVDSARLPYYDRRWVEEHVEFQNVERFKQLHEGNNRTGMLIATGHLGSFELLAHSAALLGFPLAFVVRDFKTPQLDDWWRSVREANGNRVISRRGAMKRAINLLKSGTDVGFLFDQNVTRNRAVFVDFFSRKAATTRAVAVAALKTRAPMLVAAIARKECGSKHKILWEECPVEDIYENPELPQEEKILMITERASRLFEQMVREHYVEWFWFHRRWKTQPSDQIDHPYSCTASAMGVSRNQMVQKH